MLAKKITDLTSISSVNIQNDELAIYDVSAGTTIYHREGGVWVALVTT